MGILITKTLLSLTPSLIFFQRGGLFNPLKSNKMADLSTIFARQLAHSRLISPEHEEREYDELEKPAVAGRRLKQLKIRLDKEKGGVLKTRLGVKTSTILEKPVRPKMNSRSLVGSRLNRGARGIPSPTSPVIQLNKIPFLIELNQYKDPETPENPIGDLLATYRFSLLANAVPTFSKLYNPSGLSVEKVWENMVFGASAESSFAQMLFSQAQEDFKIAELQEFSSISDSWWPVYPNPWNWTDIIAGGRGLEKITLDLSNPENLTDGFNLIAEEESLSWNTENENHEIERETLADDSQIREIEMKIMRVDFVRRWLDPQLFKIGGWKIDGVDKGFFSSGNLKENQGVLPLLPNSMLIGTGVRVKGRIGAKDERLVRNRARGNRTFSIGPFVLGSQSRPPQIRKSRGETIIESNNAHIIGFVSSLVPMSPREE